MTDATWVAPRLRPTALETCTAVAVGDDPFAPALPPPAGSVREALEAVVLEGLRRPPCLVSFSGGRDSSMVLALATHVARRHGTAPPIPVTNRFPGVPESDESSWQELVVAHLGLDDWLRLDWGDELDLVGPYAARTLRRHGLVLPFNAHFHEPLAERAAGGTMLTGVGGDQLLGARQRPITLELLAGRRRRPYVREIPAFARELLPRPARRRLARRRTPYDGLHWLRADVASRLVREYAEFASSAPLRWDRAVHWFARQRFLRCGLAALDALGAAHDVTFGHPLADPLVLSTIASVYGPGGPPGRATTLLALVGDLLPREILERRTKASFDAPFFASHSRRFSETWDGTGVDERLVSPDALRDEWATESPDAHSALLLQQAFLRAGDRSG